MAGKCGDCRFYQGKNCELQPGTFSSMSSCGNFVHHMDRPTEKRCRTCRWWVGKEKKCQKQPGSGFGPLSSCGQYSAFR